MTEFISIDVKFSESFYKKLDHASYEKALEKATDHTTSDAENTCRREAPIDTGNLRRSITKNKPGPGTGEIKSSAPYWGYVQYGTSKMSANPFVTRTANIIAPNLKKYTFAELKNMGVL